MLLALGHEGLERLIDCADGNDALSIPQTEMEWRDEGSYVVRGIVAYAKADVEGVLAALKARGWDDVRIGRTLELVASPLVLPYLLALSASKEPLDRAAAVSALARHRDPRSTAALLRALRDRSSSVRWSAIGALGESGDVTAVAPLERLREKKRDTPRDRWLVRWIGEAIEKLETR